MNSWLFSNMTRLSDGNDEWDAREDVGRALRLVASIPLRSAGDEGGEEDEEGCFPSARLGLQLSLLLLVLLESDG